MKFKADEIVALLQTEINWCLDHPSTELTYEQQMGFLNGLRQAQYLVQAATRKVVSERAWRDWVFIPDNREMVKRDE